MSDTFIKALIYGEFGAGKTWLSCTATDSPLMAPVKFVSCEGGELTIKSTDAEVVRVTTTGQLNTVHLGLRKAINEDSKTQYRTVVVDSVTAVRDMYLEELLARPNRKIDIPTIQEWGYVNIMLKRIVRHWTALDMNVIFTSLPRFMFPPGKDDDPNAQPTLVTPDFSRKLNNAVCAMFDHVWWLAHTPTKEDPQRRSLLCQPTGPYTAKTRGYLFSQKLGTVVPNPNLSEIFAHLQNTEGSSP